MANEPTTPVTHTPIQLESLGITLNSPANLSRDVVAGLESRLTPEFKQKAEQIEQLARSFQSLAEGLPSDISLNQAYAALKATGGKIDDSVAPWLREFAAKVKDSGIPLVGGAVSTVQNAGTVGDILSGAVNTGYDALMFLPRLASATTGKAKEFWNSFDPTMSGDEAKAFAVLYASLQQDAMLSHDSLPMMTMPFDGKDSKIESNPVAYGIAAIKNWGSKLLNLPVLREISAGIMAACQFALQYLNKEPHERLGFSQLYAAAMGTISTNATTIGSVEELARGSVLDGQRTAAAQKLTGFFGENSLAGELASAVAAQSAVRTKDGAQQIDGDSVTPLNEDKPGFISQVTGSLGETLQTPGGAVGAAATVGAIAYNKDRIVGAASRVGTGLADMAKGGGRLVTNTVTGVANMGVSGLGGTVAGISDGLARPYGMTGLMGDIAKQPTTVAASATRAATNTVVQTIDSGAARLTGAAVSETAATASRTFRATQAAGKVVGRAAAPLTIATAGWDVVKGIEAYQAGDTEEATRRGTSVGFAATGASIGAGIGALFGGVGAGPGALIGAGVGGIADYFVGDTVADALIGEDGKPATQVSPEQQAKLDALEQAGREAEARAANARIAAIQAAGQLQINKPVAHIGSVGSDNLRPSDAPSSTDTLNALGLGPVRN